ncbi:HIV Tat-specific factor 1 [Phyllopteryx taeniolatus]|uniref:HIV Tat-specific factor 1 n=1 Tax=Phyllopteryx taeniolatus TaxID=161469 RepID=UPI002AD49225|nr:HIV Tat-specific factor 1 [Phyllopteryx taeniolatus]XP_061606914.1 HIV Tat-specific factor 1 [Phyllopteryx taeniolatus]
MSGEANKEFEEQLRLQELYSRRSQVGSDPFAYTDPDDGTVYDWDHDKKAWFPKITEDFMAAYQANYGFAREGDPDAGGAATETEKRPAAAREEAGARELISEQQKSAAAKDGKQRAEKRKADPGWFDMEDDKNTNVYVTGLPPDTSTEEFVALMSKCGIVMRDPLSEDFKVKLYKDQDGNLKGDGLCCYLKRESVELAVRLLDESEVRGYKLHVEVARFQLKGQYDASKKKKKNKEYRKKMQQQQKQLDWRPEKQADARKRHEKVVIVRNMFQPADFEEDPLVLNEYRDDLRSECEKFGEVKKVILFDRHPDGVASVAFKEQEHADACVASFHGRWFAGRQLAATLWDGNTDYQVEETSREREERLKGWSSFLEAAQLAGGPAPSLPAGGPAPSLPAGGPAAEASGSAPQTLQQPEGKQGDDEETKSTDSSLAGSDDDDDA